MQNLNNRKEGAGNKWNPHKNWPRNARAFVGLESSSTRAGRGGDWRRNGADPARASRADLWGFGDLVCEEEGFAPSRRGGREGNRRQFSARALPLLSLSLGFLQGVGSGLASAGYSGWQLWIASPSPASGDSLLSLTHSLGGWLGPRASAPSFYVASSLWLRRQDQSYSAWGLQE